MDVLNIVFSVLNLLATVIIGVIQVTWMISKDVFGPDAAQNIIPATKKIDRQNASPSNGQSFLTSAPVRS